MHVIDPHLIMYMYVIEEIKIIAITQSIIQCTKMQLKC